MKRILITAIGSFAAEAAITSCREAGLRVIGCDIYPREWLSQSLLVDAFYPSVPAAEGDAYIQRIQDICIKESVEAILPLTDVEVDILSARRDELPAALLLCHNDIITTCRNKEIFGIHVQGILQAIPTLQLDKAFEQAKPGEALFEDYPAYPLVIKPVDGRSSIGLRRADSDAELALIQEVLKGREMQYIVQPFLEGRIVTVDFVRNARTGFYFALPREELLRTPNGAGTSVRIFRDEYLEEDIQLLADLFGINGSMCMEFIRDEEGEYHVMDCNPRFSGGIAFSKEAGFDFVKAHLACFADGEDELSRFDPGDPAKVEDDIYIVKKYSEVRM